MKVPMKGIYYLYWIYNGEGRLGDWYKTLIRKQNKKQLRFSRKHIKTKELLKIEYPFTKEQE